jgi:hypothetical protein
MKHEIVSDGVTVWVNNEIYCIGRFGKFGIDIHKAPSNSSECLFCTHGPVTKADWDLFVTKMDELYRVKISNRYMPKRFRWVKRAITAKQLSS